MTDARCRRDQIQAGWVLLFFGGVLFPGGLGFLWDRGLGIWVPLLMAVGGASFLICGLVLLLPGSPRTRQWVAQEFLTPLPRPGFLGGDLLGCFFAIDLGLAVLFLLALLFGT